MSEALLFVYGTLRAGFAGPMAQRLRRERKELCLTFWLAEENTYIYEYIPPT